jgi:transcriptional regulator GlxA family with amidase domain
MGLAAETLSRGFRAAFGVTPARFRGEVRTRRAMEMILQTDASLAEIAIDCGYSDQPHLTRAVVALTGKPPGQWRQSNSFKNGDRRQA